MILSGLIIDLVRPLARITAFVAALASFVLTIGTPLTLYYRFRDTRSAQAEIYAQRIAELVVSDNVIVPVTSHS